MILKINLIINNLQVKCMIMMIFNKKNFKKIKINFKKKIKTKTTKMTIKKNIKSNKILKMNSIIM